MKHLVWLTVVLLLAFAGSAMAQEDKTGFDATPPPEIPEAEPRTTDRDGGFSLRVGPYAPDDIFGGEATSIDFEDVYGSGFTPMYGAAWEYQPVHHKYIGVLGLGGSAMFYRNKGRALKEDGTLSSQDLTLLLIPATLDITYRMSLFDDQPVVPYAGVGGDYWYFQEGKEGGETVTGAKRGWHWRAGGQLLLDVFDPTAAGALDSNWGINNTYIFGEYRNISLSNDGFDFSAETWFAGLYFEY